MTRLHHNVLWKSYIQFSFIYSTALPLAHAAIQQFSVVAISFDISDEFLENTIIILYEYHKYLRVWFIWFENNKHKSYLISQFSAVVRSLM